LYSFSLSTSKQLCIIPICNFNFIATDLSLFTIAGVLSFNWKLSLEEDDEFYLDE
jgi:hypothetical protein